MEWLCPRGVLTGQPRNGRGRSLSWPAIIEALSTLATALIALYLLAQGQRDRRRLREDQRSAQARNVIVRVVEDWEPIDIAIPYNFPYFSPIASTGRNDFPELPHQARGSRFCVRGEDSDWDRG